MLGAESRQAICPETSQSDAAFMQDEGSKIFTSTLSKAWIYNELEIRMISVPLKDITNNILCHS
jgi:hypothetical protein